MRADSEEGELPDRYPIRGIFPICCAWAIAATSTTATIRKIERTIVSSQTSTEVLSDES